MNVAKACVIYFTLMSSTVFTWFVMGKYMIQIIVALAGEFTTVQEIQDVAQNVIYGVNALFIIFLIVWTLWFYYALHSDEHEKSYSYYSWR